MGASIVGAASLAFALGAWFCMGATAGIFHLLKSSNADSVTGEAFQGWFQVILATLSLCCFLLFLAAIRGGWFNAP